MYKFCRFIVLLSLVAFMNLESRAELNNSFMMKDLAGKEHHLSDYHGKWVLVNYWATWCPPCLDEIPDLVSLHENKKSKDLVVLGVAVDYKSELEVRNFVDDMLISYPVILGNSKIYSQYGAPEILPTTYLYNPQGKLVKVKRGQISKQYIEQLMKSNESGLIK